MEWNIKVKKDINLIPKPFDFTIEFIVYTPPPKVLKKFFSIYNLNSKLLVILGLFNNLELAKEFFKVINKGKFNLLAFNYKVRGIAFFRGSIVP